MNGKEILEKAIEITNTGERQLNYGSPEDSFQRISDLWNHYIKNKRDRVAITPKDVAIMMILFKVARLESNPEHEDSLLDVAGYVACLANIIGKSAPKNAQTNASKVSHEEATKAYGWTQNKSTSTLGCLGGLS